jgi:hypothetical protein
MGTVHASFEPRRGEDTGRLTLPSKANPHPDGRHFESQPTGASDARTAVPRPPLRLYQALLPVMAGHPARAWPAGLLVPASTLEDCGRLFAEDAVVRNRLDHRSALSRLDPIANAVDRTQEVDAALAETVVPDE